MKPTMVNHELRVIHFEYKSDASLSELESSAVMEYLKMHNDLAALYKMQKRMEEMFSEIQPEISIFEDELDWIEQGVKSWGTIAGYSMEECESEEYKNGTSDFPQLFTRCLTHQDKREIFYEKLNKLFDEFKKWDEDTDKMEEKIDWFEATYHDPIFKDYEKMEIDWYTFDNDLQEFYKMYDDLIRKIHPDFIKYFNRNGERLKSYAQKSDVVYSRLELIQRHLNKLSNETDFTAFHVD
ncbi:MAG: hypothetical protein IPJ03_03610 [Ignavibacteriales bacterium]|nr:hypothetical protein [Ignavibacteriales bacterium]